MDFIFRRSDVSVDTVHSSLLRSSSFSSPRWYHLHAFFPRGLVITVVPALGDPRRERPPAVYGHVINVPTHVNVPIRPSDERPPAMYGQFCHASSSPFSEDSSPCSSYDDSRHHCTISSSSYWASYLSSNNVSGSCMETFKPDDLILVID